MKSKKLAIITGVFTVLAVGFVFQSYRHSKSPISGMLEQEWLEQRFPEKVDTDDSIWQVLPYGYTLGPWPTRFRDEPIVTKLTYTKGPPKKFIQTMAQLWQPVEAELTLMGPKTLIEGKTQSDWKTCFESKWGCLSDRNLILDYASRGKPANALKKATWFDHPELEGPRGVHLHWDFEKYRIDDFVLITSNGIAQGFEMKTVKSGIGIDALDLFYRTLASLKVNENLSNGREWIQNRIKSVNLSEVQNNPDSRRRLLKLIEVQNWLLSLLSVDPTKITPFFHLAGVTHLLSLELIRLQDHYFENQESWILSSKPNLESIYQYSKDFDDASLSKQIEVLLQDVLLKQQQSSNLLKK